jgi:hypothetical protein
VRSSGTKNYARCVDLKIRSNASASCKLQGAGAVPVHSVPMMEI